MSQGPKKWGAPEALEALGWADAEHDRARELLTRASRRRAAAAVAAAEAGHSTRAIAAALGVSQPVVVRLIAAGRSHSPESGSSGSLSSDLPRRGRRRSPESASGGDGPEPGSGAVCLRGDCGRPAEVGRFCGRHAWA